MKYSLHVNMREHINKQSRQLLEGVKKDPLETPLPVDSLVFSPEYNPPQRSKRPEMDMSDMGAIKIYAKGHRDKYMEYKVVCHDMQLTLDASEIETVYKLTSNLLKETLVAQTVSENFIFKTIIQWMVDNRHTPSNPASELADSVLAVFEKASKKYAVYFPIQHLEMEGSIAVGRCIIGQASKADIEKQVQSYDGKGNNVEIIWLVRQHTCAKYEAQAEKEKALALAARQTALSVDTLKILFASWLPVDQPIVFDLDFKSQYQESNKLMIQAVDDLEDNQVTHAQACSDEQITPYTFQKLEEAGLPILHDFLRSPGENPTEICLLLINAIGNYADAVSHPSTHDRITKIFTVLESLLLPSNTANILESLARYLPKIISTHPQERKAIVKDVKSLYEIRSNFMHHARRDPFELSMLVNLHDYTRRLLIAMIAFSHQWQTKQDMLNEIEERINAA